MSTESHQQTIPRSEHCAFFYRSTHLKRVMLTYNYLDLLPYGLRIIRIRLGVCETKGFFGMYTTVGHRWLLALLPRIKRRHSSIPILYEPYTYIQFIQTARKFFIDSKKKTKKIACFSTLTIMHIELAGIDHQLQSNFNSMHRVVLSVNDRNKNAVSIEQCVCVSVKSAQIKWCHRVSLCDTHDVVSASL